MKVEMVVEREREYNITKNKFKCEINGWKTINRKGRPTPNEKESNI